MSSVIKSPIMRYHGGKFRLAPWVMSFFPRHKTYVEPFGGAAGVLMQKPRAWSEVYNDLDGEIANVFRVLQSPDQSDRLINRLLVTPYSRDEFEQSYEPAADNVEQACRTLIRAHMGFGSAGATKQSTGFRIDSAREYGTSAHLWARYPAQITAFCQRLSGVVIENRPAEKVIENRPAEKVIENHDRPDTLFYVDPPYMLDTRVMNSDRCYQHEMTTDDHEQLLLMLGAVNGHVVLSGYDHDLYNDLLQGWEKHQTKARISSGRGTGVRTESLWLSPSCAEQKPQQEIFA